MSGSGNDNGKGSGAGKHGTGRRGGRRRPGDVPRIGHARSISDLMPDAGRAAFRRFGFVQSSVVSRWPEIVGERYAGISAPECIRFPRGKKEGGTLELTVAGAHATLMQHVTPEITERVNRFFGYPAVEKIKIRQGPARSSDLHAEPARTRPELRPVPKELGDSLREVSDPELHAVLESLARGVATSDGLPKIGDGPARKKGVKDGGENDD